MDFFLQKSVGEVYEYFSIEIYTITVGEGYTSFSHQQPDSRPTSLKRGTYT